MKKFSFLLLCTCFLMLFSSVTVSAQSEKPYKDGPVWDIRFVKTVEGMSDAYLQNLSEHWVKLLTAAKARGLILDYKILSSPAATKSDWSLMLMTEVKDYAALDGFDQKWSALARDVLGSGSESPDGVAALNKMRLILGEKLAQEIIFK